MTSSEKHFDCVAWVREIRARIDAEYCSLSLAERARRMNENARKSSLWIKRRTGDGSKREHSHAAVFDG
ncbi:MAG: hypothetical protein HY719_01265 [Planctomycetes bacterium]|nr:hypothetical protein [Planctomycetota bacterium]